jgi:hypothetical protein
MAPRTQEGKGAKEKGLFDVKKRKIYGMKRSQMTIPRKWVSRKVKNVKNVMWEQFHIQVGKVLPWKVHTRTYVIISIL